MPLLRTSQRLWRQPRGPVRVDWSNPLARKLYCARVFSIPNDAVTGAPLNFRNASAVPRADGNVEGIGSTAFDQWEAPWPRLDHNARTEMHIWFTRSRVIYGQWSSSPGSTQDQLHGEYGDAEFTWRIQNATWNGTEQLIYQMSAPFSLVGKLVVCVVTWANTTAGGDGYGRAYFNGVFGMVGGTQYNGQSQRLTHTTGGSALRSVNNDQSQIAFCAWDRGFSHDEAVEISARPWQLFLPINTSRPIYYNAAQFARPIADVSNSGWRGVAA